MSKVSRAHILGASALVAVLGGGLITATAAVGEGAAASAVGPVALVGSTNGVNLDNAEFAVEVWPRDDIERRRREPVQSAGQWKWHPQGQSIYGSRRGDRVRRRREAARRGTTLRRTAPAKSGLVALTCRLARRVMAGRITAAVEATNLVWLSLRVKGGGVAERRRSSRERSSNGAQVAREPAPTA